MFAWAALAGGIVRVDVGVVVLMTDSAVYSIVERAGHEKALWSRIGVAFENKDGSFTFKLDFFPRDPATGLQVRWAEEGEG